LNQTSFASLEYAGKKRQTRREKFLGEMERVVPWQRLTALIEPHYPSSGRVGRPPIGVSRMLQMFFLQQWYRLSDEGLDDAVYDSQALREFIGIDLAREQVPDATALLKFRRKLEDNKLTEAIFNEVRTHLSERGLLMREVTLVDATIIAAPPSTKNKDKARDPEMHRTRKGNEWHVATKRGVVKAMPEGFVKELTIAVERKKTQIRSRVDHPYYVLKNLFHYKKVSYRGLAKNAARLFALFALVNLVLAKRALLDDGSRGIGAS
jgi:transposase, IS5 family